MSFAAKLKAYRKVRSADQQAEYRERAAHHKACVAAFAPILAMWNEVKHLPIKEGGQLIETSQVTQTRLQLRPGRVFAACWAGGPVLRFNGFEFSLEEMEQRLLYQISELMDADEVNDR
jgi:type VI protein secretion system component VasF